MKKLFGIMAVVLMITLTGCGGSKIVCTTKNADDTFAADTKITFKFDSSNNLKEISFSGKLDSNENAESYFKLAELMGFYYDSKINNGVASGKINVEKYKEAYSLSDLKKSTIKDILAKDNTMTCK